MAQVGMTRMVFRSAPPAPPAPAAAPAPPAPAAAPAPPAPAAASAPPHAAADAAPGPAPDPEIHFLDAKDGSGRTLWFQPSPGAPLPDSVALRHLLRR